MDAPKRYVVANGYGADPASHTDRTLLARDPYAVIEGAAIVALAIGASEAFIAIRAEDTDLIARVGAAVGAATEAGFIGADVLGSGHDLFIDRPAGAGRLHARRGDGPAQGARGQARAARAAATASRDRGPLRRMPTVVHNVQTLAAIPGSCAKAPTRSARSAPTTPRAPSSSRSAVPAATGIAEVPLGTPLGDIVASAASCPRAARQGHPGRRSVRWAAAAGPRWTRPTRSTALREAGAHVGSGSVVVVDDRTVLVELAGS